MIRYALPESMHHFVGFGSRRFQGYYVIADLERYVKVSHLRTLLPNGLLSPLLETINDRAFSQQQQSPAALYTRLQKPAINGKRSIDAFKKAWHGDDIRSLWEIVKLEDNLQGHDSWKVDYRVLTRTLKVHANDTEEVVVPVEGDTKDVVQQFKNHSGSVKIKVMDGEAGTPIQVKIAGMTFIVKREAGNPTGEYHVESRSGTRVTEMQQGIMHCMNRKESKKSLSQLLVRITSACWVSHIDQLTAPDGVLP